MLLGRLLAMHCGYILLLMVLMMLLMPMMRISSLFSHLIGELGMICSPALDSCVANHRQHYEHLQAQSNENVH